MPQSVPESVPAPATSEAERMWASIEHANSAAELEFFIKRFPQSSFADLARVRLKEMRSNHAALDAAPPKEKGAPQARRPEARRSVKEAKVRVCRRESIPECRARVTGNPNRVAWGKCVFRPMVCR